MSGHKKSWKWKTIMLFKIVADTGTHQRFQQRTAVFRVTGPQKWHPGIVDELGGLKHQTPAVSFFNLEPISLG
jgi:hypothetical protein